MLGRLLRTSTFVLMSLLLSTAPSEAGVPIPCTGESLVKVLDIPALAHVEVDASGRETKSRRDLGYKFSGCTGGEWVVHVGSKTRYIPLSEGQLQLMLLAAGLTEPPPAPSFWSSGQSVPVYIWGVAIGFVAIGVLFKGRGQQQASGQPESDGTARAPLSASDAAVDDPRWAAVAARMQSGSSTVEPRAPAATARAMAARPPVVSPRGLAQPGTAPAFGRRR